MHPYHRQSHASYAVAHASPAVDNLNQYRVVYPCHQKARKASAPRPPHRIPLRNLMREPPRQTLARVPSMRRRPPRPPPLVKSRRVRGVAMMQVIRAPARRRGVMAVRRALLTPSTAITPRSVGVPALVRFGVRCVARVVTLTLLWRGHAVLLLALAAFLLLLLLHLHHLHEGRRVGAHHL